MKLFWKVFWHGLNIAAWLFVLAILLDALLTYSKEETWF